MGGLMQLIAYGAQDVYLGNPVNTRNNRNGNPYFREIEERVDRVLNQMYNNNRQPAFDESRVIFRSSRLKNGTECPITMCPINKGEKYTKCYQCKKAFDWGSMVLWLRDNSTCPHCRTNLNMDNMPKLINKHNEPIKRKGK